MASIGDLLQSSLSAVEELFVLDAYNRHVYGLEIGIACLVFLGLTRFTMTFAIELDDKLMVVAEEVRHVIADLVLSPKL